MSWFRVKGNLGTRLRQPWFGGAFGAVLATAFGLVLLYLPGQIDIGKGLRDWSYDLPFLARSEAPKQDIIIIYLDEESYRELKQSPADFDRSLHARLIRKLKADGAKMIVFDILFVDPKKNSAAADRDLAQAMREHGKVVLGGQFEQVNPLDSIIWPPIDPLRDACAGWGLVNVHQDADFEVRLHFENTNRFPSLAWKSAEIFGTEITRQPENRLRKRWLNYYSHMPFQEISYFNAIDQSQPAGFFKDKIVFIGEGADVAGYGGDLREQFRSPWTWLTGDFQLGVEGHALTFSNLVQKDWLRRMPWQAEALVVMLAGLMLGYGLSLFRPLAATGLACAFALVATAISFMVFARFNLWFPWLIPVAAQLPAALAWSYLFHSIRSYMETKLLETSLALYLSPHQVSQIVKRPELLKPGGMQQTVSILFSDIANFSTLSERMAPNDLVKLLNTYYETAIECVHQAEGTVMSLIGDALFVIWNAPQEQSDHGERACRTALLLREQLVRFDAGNTGAPLRTRIGLHTGVACVGNVGSSAHFDYTAIGESVNIASRVEGLNRLLGTNILATREIQTTIKGSIVTRPVGRFKFKGFGKVAEVYELISTAESGDSSRAWRQAFEKALADFQRRLFREAARGFQQTLLLRPNDGPAQYYLAKIDEFQDRQLPEDWLGEVELTEK